MMRRAPTSISPSLTPAGRGGGALLQLLHPWEEERGRQHPQPRVPQVRHPIGLSGTQTLWVPHTAGYRIPGTHRW